MFLKIYIVLFYAQNLNFHPLFSHDLRYSNNNANNKQGHREFPNILQLPAPSQPGPASTIPVSARLPPYRPKNTLRESN